MNTAKAFSLCKKIRNKTGQSVTIEHRVWVFSTKQHQMYFRLTYFTSHDICQAETFQKWSEVETFCKEKWDV